MTESWETSFVEWLARKGRGGNTVKAYRQALAEFASWFAQANGTVFSPELLSSFDLVRYRTWVLDVARKSPATWNSRLAALRALASWAGKQVDLPAELFDDVNKEDPGQLPPDWLNDAEFGRLGSYLHSTAFDAKDNTVLRQARATRNRALVVVMLYAGLREFEAANLQMDDVQLSARKGTLVVQRGKNGKKREIPMGDARARAVIERWLQVRGCGRGFVFTDDGGGKLAERTIQEIAAEIGGKCKVPDLRPHRLRHTFCKRMVDAGVGIETVARLAGHASIQTTRRYVEPGREDLERATGMVAMGRMARVDYQRS